MTERKSNTLLKIEGLIFSLAVIFFLVIFYFNYISKYFVCISILFFSAVLFSINATLTQTEGKISSSKFNIFLSALFFFAGLGLSIYFYATGLIAF